MSDHMKRKSGAVLQASVSRRKNVMNLMETVRDDVTERQGILFNASPVIVSRRCFEDAENLGLLLLQQSVL